MQITGLPQSGAFGGNDVLAIEINGITYKLTGSTLAAAITSIGSLVTGVKGSSEQAYRNGNVSISKANIGLGNVDNTADADKPISTAVQTAFDAVGDVLDGKINYSDVVNNLTSTETTKPLSAAQGKALNEAIQQSMSSLIGAIDLVTSRIIPANAMLSINGINAGAHFLVIVGGWNYAQTFIVYPANGSAPKKILLASYIGSSDTNFPVSAYGDWGFTIQNNTSYTVPIKVFSMNRQ